MKRLAWRHDAVFSLKLQDHLYSLCQMREGSIMEFFAVSAHDDAWKGTDLSQQRVLAQYFVAENRLKSIFSREVDASEALPNGRALSRLMLSPIIEANGRYGASLVRLNSEYSMLGVEVITADLDPKVDWQTIHDHELMGMQGSAEKLRSRLLRYFTAGVWWDEQKSFLFPGIPMPEPESGFIRRLGTD